MRDVKIVIAAHKDYPVPTDGIYLPLQVGAAVNGNITSYQKDNTGDNISAKNPRYCELTGLYWAWKNLNADYVGLVHYRRYFTSPLGHSELTAEQVDKLLEKSDIVLPKKRHYFIENLYDHYTHTLYREPLEMVGKIILEKYPGYYIEFQKLQERMSAHMFNMFIMKKEALDAYCEWLFPILFELEECIKEQGIDAGYSDFHARFYGRISELLLDVYIRTNNLDYVEAPVHSTEPMHWGKKIRSFLMAKYMGRKYEASF